MENEILSIEELKEIENNKLRENPLLEEYKKFWIYMGDRGKIKIKNAE